MVSVISICVNASWLFFSSAFPLFIVAFPFPLPILSECVPCSLSPLCTPARAGSTIPRHCLTATGHPSLQGLPHSAEPALCLAEKNQTNYSETEPPPAPSSCSHRSLGPSRRPLQDWWHGSCNNKGQSRPRQGLVIELTCEFWGFLFTSDQTHKYQTLTCDGLSHLPSPKSQTPLNTGAISAPRLSPCPP